MMWLQMAAAAALVIPLGLDLYMPVPDDNPITAQKIALGRELFFDTRLSRDRSISCSTCHVPARAFSDGRVLAVGIGGRVGTRHTPALINRGYGQAFFWDARTPSLEEQVLKPIEDQNEMDFTVAEAAARVALTPSDMSRALASYVRSILSGASPYDRYVDGDRMALTQEEQRGLAVFRGKGNCAACHVGPNFTDERTHVTGIAWSGKVEGQAPVLRDDGAGRGAFKTPTLREIASTAPYMHDGSLDTLEHVVDFYERGGKPNPYLDAEMRPGRFSVDEKRALLAFLLTLSGEVNEGSR